MVYSLSDITALHKKYAPSDIVFDLVFTHSRIVYDLCRQLLENGIDVNTDLVLHGALLHDIGVYPLFSADGKLKEGVNYITHGIEGERILKDEGFPEAMWRLASHHTGVGLTKQDVIGQKLPLPIEDYLAESDEELLIMYADKFHSKTTPPYFNSFEWYKHDVSKFGTDKIERFDAMAAKFGKPDLAPLSEIYGFAIR